MNRRDELLALSDERGSGADALRAVVVALIDPAAEARYRRQLCAEAWRDGYRAGVRAAPRSGYRAGFDLGFDTGYSARQDSRAFVRGVTDGFAAGTEDRRRLVARLLARRGGYPVKGAAS